MCHIIQLQYYCYVHLCSIMSIIIYYQKYKFVLFMSHRIETGTIISKDFRDNTFLEIRTNLASAIRF